jgi:hypothetical protein
VPQHVIDGALAEGFPRGAPQAHEMGMHVALQVLLHLGLTSMHTITAILQHLDLVS